MIGIKLEGASDYLDIADDTVIELTLENPMLGDAERLSPGSLSMPFNLPGGTKSPANAAQLKNPDVIENNESYVVQKATLSFDNVPLKKGTLKADGSDRDSISAYFKFGLNSISEELKTKQLRDLVNQEVVIDDTPITKMIYIKRVSGGPDLNVTINGKNYIAANLLTLFTMINVDYNTSDGSQQYVPIAGLVSVGPNSPNGIAPPYIHLTPNAKLGVFDIPSTNPLVELSVTVPAEDANDYALDSFDMTDYYTGFENYLADYISGSYPNDALRFPAMFNPGLHGDKKIKVGEMINAVTSAGLVVNSSGYVRTNLNSIQPFIRMKWLIDKIADYFDLEGVEGSFYEDAALENILVDNSQTLDVPQPFIGDTEFIFWRRSFNMNELVPEMTVVEMLKGVASRYNLGVTVNEQNNKLRMVYRENVAVSNDYTDITPLCSPIGPRNDLRVTGYSIHCKKEDSDAFSAEELFGIGTSEKPFEINCGRLHQLHYSIPEEGGFVTGPRTSRKNGDKFGLRIFHYLGIVDNGVFSYPAADINGAGVSETIADYIVLPGLHSRFFKYWLHYESRRLQVQLSADFGMGDIQYFDWEKKYRFDRTNYMVKTMKLRMTKRALEVTKLDLITMR